MSPWPSSASAPLWSRITRESVWLETANAIRDGTFALIIPVITSTRGDCVASTKWMPTARAFCARRMIESSTSAGRDHHQVGELVDHAQDVGQRRLAALLAGAVELGEAARPRQRHRAVALLHLLDEVLERVRRHPRARDHRGQQVWDAFVVVELDLLWVDEHESHLVRRGAQQDARQHRVHARGLPRSGRPRDQQVRHLRQVGADRAAGDVLAEPDRQRGPVGGRVLEHISEVDDPPAGVWNLDADGLLAGDRRQDPDVGRGQRVGQVVLQLRDLRDLRPGREPQLITGDMRPGDATDHLGLDPEVAERLDQGLGDLLLSGGVGLRGLAGRAGQEARRRDPPFEVRVVGDRAAVAALRRQILG